MPNIGTQSAQGLLLIVFPVFFAYQTLAAFGVIPLILGGGLSLFAGLALVALGPFVLFRLKEFWPAVAVLAALSAIVLAYAAYYRLFGSDYQRHMGLALSSVKLVSAWGGFFCIGLLIKPSELFRRVLFWAVILMAVVTPFLVKTPALSLIDTVRSGWGVASYQFFSDAFAFTAMLAVVYAWGRKSEPWLVAVSLATIFLLLSRSGQAGLLAAFAGWGVLKLLHGQYRPLLVAVAGTAAILGASLLLQPVVPDLVAAKNLESGVPSVDTSASDIIDRQMEIVNLGESKSWSERGKFLTGGVDDIMRSPVVGDYAGQVRDFGFFGAYIHNALSAWRQYGFVAFLLYVGLSVSAFAGAGWHVVWRRETDPGWLAAAMISGFSLLLILGAKSVYWPMPALGWGMTTAMLALAPYRQAAGVTISPVSIEESRMSD